MLCCTISYTRRIHTHAMEQSRYKVRRNAFFLLFVAVVVVYRLPECCAYLRKQRGMHICDMRNVCSVCKHLSAKMTEITHFL